MRVRLDRSEVSQYGKLLGVRLPPCDHEAPPVFGSVRRRPDDGIHECPDELLRGFVARHEFRRTPHGNRKHERWFLLVGAGRAHHEIVDRVLGRLLERDAHDVSAVAEFTGAVTANQAVEPLRSAPDGAGAGSPLSGAAPEPAPA